MNLKIDNITNCLFGLLSKIFRNKSILVIIKYYNLIILSLYFLGSLIYLFDFKSYMTAYSIIVAFLGFNLFSLIPIGYIVTKFNFCSWAKMAYISNVIICFVEIVFSILDVFYPVSWDGLIMFVLSLVLLIFTTKYVTEEWMN